MAERDVELRLASVARALDAEAPVFDPAVLRAPGNGGARRRIVAFAILIVLGGIISAPSAISALRDLFEVEWVSELGPVGEVAPAFTGRPTTLDEAQLTVPFHLRTIPSLGVPHGAYVRDDIRGGMVTVAYDGGRIRLTQWPAPRVQARATVVPVSGTVDEVSVGDFRALWIVGTARGTFTLIGADGTVHRELFDVADGALIWEDAGVAFLLQGAATSADAARLAADVTS